ncbi:hypothetical protein [Alkalihalobacillus pseudalcaliphilus]|uniref:hypothetical protein n=1 Tax=Alkalihalobacillus pseudalcaliphilus TaxID=79884 RepID=UPI000A9DC73F|nr:hypothetical protein [Alkalihalobacillus pseudalcaliphilus]
MLNNKQKSLELLFQLEKQHISLLSRHGYDQNSVFPLSIRQTRFPWRFEQNTK